MYTYVLSFILASCICLLVCNQVVHKRCHQSVLTECPGSKAEKEEQEEVSCVHREREREREGEKERDYDKQTPEYSYKC